MQLEWKKVYNLNLGLISQDKSGGNYKLFHLKRSFNWSNKMANKELASLITVLSEVAETYSKQVIETVKVNIDCINKIRSAISVLEKLTIPASETGTPKLEQAVKDVEQPQPQQTEVCEIKAEVKESLTITPSTTPSPVIAVETVVPETIPAHPPSPVCSRYHQSDFERFLRQHDLPSKFMEQFLKAVCEHKGKLYGSYLMRAMMLVTMQQAHKPNWLVDPHTVRFWFTSEEDKAAAFKVLSCGQDYRLLKNIGDADKYNLHFISRKGGFKLLPLTVYLVVSPVFPEKTFLQAMVVYDFKGSMGSYPPLAPVLRDLIFRFNAGAGYMKHAEFMRARCNYNEREIKAARDSEQEQLTHGFVVDRTFIVRDDGTLTTFEPPK